MSACCGPSPCDVSLEAYICQARKLLPDFGGALDLNGDFIAIWDAIAECVYDAIVSEGCKLAKEFNPCASDIYFEAWVQEFGLPNRCPLPDNIDAQTRDTLIRLQVCLQEQLQGGGAFNGAVLDQIADALDISYFVTVPTRNLAGVPVCDIVMMPGNKQFCNPDGCSYQQAFIVNVTCAPSDAHIDVFRCFIEEYNPCHVAHCVVDMTPSLSVETCGCTETIMADCVNLEITVASCGHTSEVIL